MDVGGKVEEQVVIDIDSEHPFEPVVPIAHIQPDGTNDYICNYFCNEPGYYRIHFSNEHSWLNPKKLMYRFCVLSPTGKRFESRQESMARLDSDEEVSGL